MTPGAGRGGARRAAGFLPGVIALAVYVRTLYPGVVVGRDTAKLQFVGRILGTPHNPGYPLYVLITHAFSYLPIGTVAYRINLFSALFGAAACVLMAAVFRRQGLGAVGSTGLALAFALGRAFWSQAIQAEVYTLAATIFAGVLLCVSMWRSTRRDGWLLGAIALAALALGHHTTIVMLAPALAAYVLATDPRTIRRPKILGATALFTVLGLTPYLFILIRTHQGAPYLESHAASLGELGDVIRSKQFASWFGVFPMREIFVSRVPMLFGVIRDELSIPGAVVAIVGLGSWIRRRQPEALLVTLGICAIVSFLADYGAEDVEVFLIPAFQLAWMAAAQGLLVLGAALHAPRIAPATAAIAIACVLAASNWRANDHSRRVGEGRFLAAVFEAVPDNAVFVADYSTIDPVLQYGLYGEGMAASRHLSFMAQDSIALAAEWRRGRPIYAFASGRAFLAERGFQFAPVPLRGLKITEDICDWTHNETLAVAGLPAAWLPTRRAAFRCFDLVRPAVKRHDDLLAFVGVAGQRAAQSVIGTAPDVTAGSHATTPVRATASPGHASIRSGAIALTCDGCVLYAVFRPDGTLVEQYHVTLADDYRVPLRAPLAPLFRASTVAPCVAAGNAGWIDVLPLMHTGTLEWRVDNYRAAPSWVDLVIAGGAAGPAGIGTVTKTGGPPEATIATAIVSTLPPALPADVAARFIHSGEVTWLHVDVKDQGQFVLLRVDLTGTPALATLYARVDLDNPRRAMICEGSRTEERFRP